MSEPQASRPAGTARPKAPKKSRRLKRLKRLGRCSKWMGSGESLFFMFCDLFGLRKVRTVRAAGETLHLRTATPDALIAAKVLVEQEYGDAECADPTVIVDAGANIGMSAIYFARKYPQARVFAIEPEKENYDLMLRNIAGHGNIVPLPVALWDRVEVRPLRSRSTGTVGFTISDTHNEAGTTGQQVDCITMEWLMQKYGLSQIDILKLDIEGGEKEVLGSSDAWIGKVRVITAELHDRICPGCARAFYVATRNFARVEKNGATVTAYRD